MKQVPTILSTRLSSLSINEDEFNKAKRLYENALKSSGFKKKKLKFESIQTTRSQNKQRKVVWFNPPYNADVKTSIGKVFLKPVPKHFRKRHHYRKTFNANTIKLSYSCTPNVKNLIEQHNNSVMASGTSTNKRDYNCRNKDNFPLDGMCLVECIFHEATLSIIDKTNIYFVSAEGGFKSRYNNHTLLFRSNEYKHCNELSKHICSLKDSNTKFRLKWCTEKSDAL